jgi:hypothetical protein
MRARVRRLMVFYVLLQFAHSFQIVTEYLGRCFCYLFSIISQFFHFGGIIFLDPTSLDHQFAFEGSNLFVFTDLEMIRKASKRLDEVYFPF